MSPQGWYYALSVLVTDIRYFVVMNNLARCVSPYINFMCGSGGTPPWICYLDRVARRNSVMLSTVPYTCSYVFCFPFSEESSY